MSWNLIIAYGIAAVVVMFAILALCLLFAEVPENPWPKR